MPTICPYILQADTFNKLNSDVASDLYVVRTAVCLVSGAEDGPLYPEAGKLVLLLVPAGGSLEGTRVHELAHLVYLKIRF